MARKTIQVNEEIHARFSGLSKKMGLDRLDYGDSQSGVLEWLIDFYEKHKSPETIAALELVRMAEKRAEEKYGQIDVFQAIEKAKRQTVIKPNHNHFKGE